MSQQKPNYGAASFLFETEPVPKVRATQPGKGKQKELVRDWLQRHPEPQTIRSIRDGICAESGKLEIYIERIQARLNELGVKASGKTATGHGLYTLCKR